MEKAGHQNILSLFGNFLEPRTRYALRLRSDGASCSTPATPHSTAQTPTPMTSRQNACGRIAQENCKEPKTSKHSSLRKEEQRRNIQEFPVQSMSETWTQLSDVAEMSISALDWTTSYSEFLNVPNLKLPTKSWRWLYSIYTRFVLCSTIKSTSN